MESVKESNNFFIIHENKIKFSKCHFHKNDNSKSKSDCVVKAKTRTVTEILNI